MSKREDFRMNPRFIARIITDEINPDLIQFKRNKLGIFLDVFIEIIISESVTLILKDKGHFYILLQG